MRTVIALVVMLVLTSCSGSPTSLVEMRGADSVRESTSCPFLTRNSKGEIVLSWIKSRSDSEHVMCYAVSPDNGGNFSDTVIIEASSGVLPHAENLPKMVFKPSGEVLAMWGTDSPDSKNKYAGCVYYSQSFDGGTTWSKARSLVEDTSSHDQRYFDLSLLPNGEAVVVWLDDRGKTAGGSSLYFAQTDGSNGFVNEKRIGEGCCPCCRTDLFVDNRSQIHVAYRKILNDSIRDMVHIVSSDTGKTFSSFVRISADNWVIDGCPHTGPTMAENEHGLQFSWYTMGGGSGIYYCRSTDNGRSYSIRDSVSASGAAKHPQMVTDSDGKIIIAWDEGNTTNGSYHSAIGLQLRAADGKHLERRTISEEGWNAEFPVLAVTDGNTVLVAYTLRKDSQARVSYTLANLN